MVIATIIPVPFFFVALPVQGFTVRIIRQTARGEKPSLPEWDDWGQLFGDGFKAWLIGLVYLLPIWLIQICVGLMLFGLWLALSVSAFGPRTNSQAFAGGFVGLIFAFDGLIFISVAITLLLIVPLVFLLQVALSRFAATDRLGSAFEFREVWNLARRGFTNYALANIVGIGTIYAAILPALILAYSVILSCLYPFALVVSTIFIQAVVGALIGTAYYYSTVPGASDHAPAVTKPLPAAPKAQPKRDVSRPIETTLAADSTPPKETIPIKKTAPPRPPDTFETMASERKWRDKDNTDMADKPAQKPGLERPPDTRKTLSGRRTPAPGKDVKKTKDE